MDLAAKEADFKGSLLDRVASLEHRLFQVCLGMQSSSTYTSSSSSRASTQTPGDSSSSHGFKGEPSSSFPAFNINAIHGDKLMSHVGVHSHEIQEVKPHRHKVAKELKIASAPRQLLGNGKSNKEEKTCKSQKKGISPNWPRLKILGC
ncbi:uncharacterized protein LOC132174133 [Corylus avellana]|uniref:uncharacterized protein LOC132174133 n=1 Tax=Corylus avellana TaxID=13451 RepID=UPI00286B4E6A|nr:uncharacterized protein LOC132174133 [Corylus avellana]